MAITRLNSLAIPAGTVEPADISYPLTNFSSTGIDDNATSTALTIDTNEDTTFAGKVKLSNGANFSVGSQTLHTGLYAGSTNGTSDDGTFALYGGRTYNAGSGVIFFGDDHATKANVVQFVNGAYSEKMRIDANGYVGIGNISPTYSVHVKDTANSANMRRITIESDSNAGANAGYRFILNSANSTVRGGGVYLQPGDTDATTYLGLSSTDTNYALVATRENNIGIGTDTPDCKLQVSGGPARIDEYQWNAGTGRRISKYIGVSSYWTQNEYIEICTITPNGASQNYFIEGTIHGQSSQSLDIVRFSVSVRSQTLPSIVYYASYDRERIGGNFQLKPFIWYDTTNGVIKVVVKNQSTAQIHNAEFELKITARTTDQARDNVSYSGAERTAVTSGFTEQDTFIFRKESYVSDTYYAERQVERPHIHGTPYGTDGQIATGMRVRQSNNLSFITDRITVPIAGVYLITLNSLSANNVQTRTDLNIRVNGSTVAADLDMAQGSNDYSGKSTQVAVDLAVNDYIQFYNTDWYTNTPSTFDNWQQASVTYIG